MFLPLRRRDLPRETLHGSARKKNGGERHLYLGEKKDRVPPFFLLFFAGFLSRSSLSIEVANDSKRHTQAESARSNFLSVPFFLKVADAIASIRDTIQLEGTPDTYRPLEV